MNLIDLKHTENIQSLTFCGDIHGEFDTLLYNIKRYNITNSILFLCGDVGMGFCKLNYYNQKINFINTNLVKRNVFIVAVRGNHDDPAYFNKTIKLDQQFSNWLFVNDYDVVLTNLGNILCIGGAVSVDRKNRLSEQYRYTNPIWWSDEIIKRIDLNQFVTDIKKSNINIDIVCTHSSPDLFEPISKDTLLYFASFDNALYGDCAEERSYLTNVYNNLIEHFELKGWFYGHFHKSYNGVTDKNVKWHGLNINEFKLYE